MIWPYQGKDPENHPRVEAISPPTKRNRWTSNHRGQSVVTCIQELEQFISFVLRYLVFLCFLKLQENLLAWNSTAPGTIILVTAQKLRKLYRTTTSLLFLKTASSDMISHEPETQTREPIKHQLPCRTPAPISKSHKMQRCKTTIRNSEFRRNK